MKKIEYSIPGLTTEQEAEIAWTKETVEDVPSKKWLYRVSCFLLGKKKLTYREMFMLIYGINKRNLGEKKSKEVAAQKIIGIYEYNNKELPEGIEHGT
jgi:hypothetical protein